MKATCKDHVIQRALIQQQLVCGARARTESLMLWLLTRAVGPNTRQQPNKVIDCPWPTCIGAQVGPVSAIHGELTFLSSSCKLGSRRAPPWRVVLIDDQSNAGAYAAMTRVAYRTVSDGSSSQSISRPFARSLQVPVPRHSSAALGPRLYASRTRLRSPGSVRSAFRRRAQ
jgi:hypothetical protein